ncbi:MAG: phage tail protein, partial [Wolbachia sp.]
MQPDFIIDKCESIKDRVISLHLTDESGIIDDVVEVCVDYRDEDIDIPNELNIALGYKEFGIFPMGIYTVNEVTIQGPPKTLLIKAHATNLRISLKAKVSKEWRQITIENLVKEIAQ